jgi:hypothetical protein
MHDQIPATSNQLPATEFIRPMTVDDLPLVHALECVAQQDPWSPEHFAAEL